MSDKAPEPGLRERAEVLDTRLCFDVKCQEDPEFRIGLLLKFARQARRDALGEAAKHCPDDAGRARIRFLAQKEQEQGDD